MTLQDFVVFAIVLAAVMYLGRTLMLSVSGRKSCGGCGSRKKCGSTAQGTSPVKPAASDQLIQISLNGGFSSGMNGHNNGHAGRSKIRPGENSPGDH